MGALEKTIKNIKRLKIQGSRRIALAGLEAMRKEITRSKARTRKAFFDEMFRKAKRLSRARPTEPSLRNVLTRLLYFITTSRIRDVGELRKFAVDLCKREGAELERIHERVSKIAARRIPHKSTILTHCHSTTVVDSFKRAWDQKKRIAIICTETRPKYQGIKTAKELSEYGIPTTLIIDAAVRFFMKEVDLVVLGADVICANGAVVNKIGSALIAATAKEHRKSLIVIAGTYKLDPMTIGGYLEKIEEREPKEIINPKKLPRVKIRNPAFDIIPPDYIDVMITEFGVHSSSEIFRIFKERFKWFEGGQAILKELMG